MGRLKPLAREACNDEQRTLFDAIAGGDRARNRTGQLALVDEAGGLIGPFNPWLRAPALGGLAQQLGATLRFHGVLGGREREIAILTIAARLRARYEWWAHARIARAEGLPDAVIDAIAAGERPALEAPREAVVHALAAELVETSRASDALYARAVEALGEQGVVEVVGLLGYYTLVGLTLNVFDVDLPPGESTPFD